MDKKDNITDESALRAREIIALLKKEYPDAKIVLRFSNPLELLVATILSAQSTDEMVNKITPRLFKKYRFASDYVDAPLKELEKDIKHVGLFRNKAKNIKGAARILTERFHSKVPSTMNEMLQLPGVARKTAHVVLGNAYGVVEGIAVDTHVSRLSRRLGLSARKSAEKIEQDLMKIVPRSDWFKFTYLLIDHGRKICQARKPRCQDCVLNHLCPSAFSFV